MKKCLFFVFLIIANANCVYSQIVAGNAASGLIISNPAVNLTVTAVYGSGSKSFDLDCDSIADIRIDLHEGPTAIDASNNAFLYILNSSFQICADTANTSFRFVNYFNLSDTILPPTDANWYNDSIMQLGDYGCFDCHGPFSASNLYFGYKNTVTSQIGWVKISFDLDDGGGSTVPITLSIPEVLSPCVTTSVSPVGTSTSTPTYTNSGVGTCGTFTYSIAYTWPSCYGYCNGGISITGVTGGASPYNYLWSPSMQTGPYINNLCSGTYYLMISDASGNTCTSTFLVQNPPQITFSLSSTNVSCNGGYDGSACCVKLMGGNPAYSYSWTPSGNFSSCITNLPTGNYSLCVADGNNCTVCHSVTVNEPSAIQVTEIIVPASCASCCDGSVQLQINGGTPAYSTSYFPSQPTCPGTYTYNVNDSNGCNYMDSVLISFATSVIEYNPEKIFDIFPNPTRGKLNIKYHVGSEEGEIQLINALGEIVLEIKNSKDDLLIDISDQPNGIYILTIRQNGLFSSVKIIKE